MGGACLADGEGCGSGELADHGEEQAAVAFAEVGGVALDLGEEADLVLVEREAGYVADDFVGEELA